MPFQINHLEEDNILETIYSANIKMLDVVMAIQKM